ncbi:MAG: diphthine synthase [Thermoplasmata archaeon]|nr:diphthine synthase [Thermoplasmata archaeon]
MGRLIFIGLGPHDGKDISLRGLEALKSADQIFAEFYTATMAEGCVEYLESLTDKKIEILTREQVETGDPILDRARRKESTVAFLVPGDPLTATTHIDLLLRAKSLNIASDVIHGPSVVTIIPGLLGLQFYKFGRTTTLAYPEGEYFPESPYDVVLENKKLGLHTLVLLDIHAEEERYMTANEGIDLLLRIGSKRDEMYTPRTLSCVVARAGAKTPIVAANEAGELLKMDFGAPMHSIVIPGNLHFKESEALVKLANAPKEILG